MHVFYPGSNGYKTKHKFFQYFENTFFGIISSVVRTTASIYWIIINTIKTLLLKTLQLKLTIKTLLLKIYY